MKSLSTMSVTSVGGGGLGGGVSANFYL
jgi:hypothetical protein